MTMIRHAAIDWAAICLTSGGRRLLAPVELVKSRAWSTVWRGTTHLGLVYIKAAGPGFEREARLLPSLAAADSGLLPRVLAADAARGWLLLTDAGVSLRDVIAADRQRGLAALASTLSRYATLQLRLAGDAGVSAHAADARLAVLPDQVAALVADTTLLMTGGATTHEAQVEFTAAIDMCRKLTDALAKHGIAASLDHGDLHANNITVAPDQTTRVIDWGDAAWGHPFASLPICLDTTNEMIALTPDETAALRAAYLAPWQRVSVADLERALDLAIALRPIHGALLWARGSHAMTGSDRAMAATWVVRWLRKARDAAAA